jgi:hypothetical protein
LRDFQLRHFGLNENFKNLKKKKQKQSFYSHRIFNFEKSDWENQNGPDKEHNNNKKQLKQESVEVLMEKRTLRWYGHAVRMESERRPKLVLEARPEGGRGRGRPRLEWEEYVERLTCKKGRKLPEVKRLAHNRKEYRKWLLEPDA